MSEADLEALEADIDAQLRAHSFVITRLEGRVDSLEREVASFAASLTKLITLFGTHADKLTTISMKLDRVVKHADTEEAMMPKLAGQLDALIETISRHANTEDEALGEHDDELLDRRSGVPKPRVTPR